MGTRVVVLEHGTDAMWITMGPFFCDRAVLKELAGPMYSGPTTTWYAAVDGDVVVGFISSREAKDVLWYDYAYVAPDRRGTGIFGELSKAREKYLKNDGRPRRATMPDRRWPHYKKRGWKKLSERGSWITIERAA